MIYLKSIVAGIAAMVIFAILVLGISFLAVIGVDGYWGFDFSFAGLSTPAGALPPS